MRPTTWAPRRRDCVEKMECGEIAAQEDGRIRPICRFLERVSVRRVRFRQMLTWDCHVHCLRLRRDFPMTGNLKG